MSGIIKPGDEVMTRCADDTWRSAVAASGLEGTHDINPATGRRRKIHSFPVVWIKRFPDSDPTPWPAEDVVLASAHKASS